MSDEQQQQHEQAQVAQAEGSHQPASRTSDGGEDGSIRC